MLSADKKEEVLARIRDIANTMAENVTIGSIAEDAQINAAELRMSNDSLMPILRTALVINWKEVAMKTRYKRFRCRYPEIWSLLTLKRVIDTTDALTFCKEYLDINADKAIPEKNPKYALLKELTNGFLEYQSENHLASEILALRHWSSRVDICKLKEDPIGRRRGVGPGVVENIRLNLGESVIKPDRHVIDIMNGHLKLSEIAPDRYNAFADFIGLDRRYLDCLLFKYGQLKGISA